MRWPTRVHLTMFVLVVTALACDLGSAPEDLPTPRPHGVRIGTPTEVATPAVDDTPIPAGTPADIPAVVSALQGALNDGDSSGLHPLLLETVVLVQGPNGESGQEMSRDAAMKWLNNHWGKRRSVVSTEYIEHFVLLSLTTQGWAAIPPLRTGSLVFHLHRFTAGGESDPVSGSWRIDTILYQ